MTMKHFLKLSRRFLSISLQTERRLSQYSSELYNKQLSQSLTNPEEYWGKISENTVWTKKWDKVLDNSNSPFVRWFVNGELSLCYNAVDRHVDDGHGGQAAIIWDSPISGAKRTISYSQLQDEVSRAAGQLSRMGVSKGDRVMVYMP